MLEHLYNLNKKGIYLAVIISIIFIFLSGLFFGFLYYVMDVTHTGLQATDCVIVDNVFVDSCQELFTISIFPFLLLRELLVWMSFFFIFGLVLACLILGYKSGESSVMLGFMVGFVAILTYGGIELSNIYRTLLENAIVNAMMVPFTIYNRVMLNFPWFVFILGLFSVILGIINFQRTPVNQISSRDEQNF